jgi:hypothetical protein
MKFHEFAVWGCLLLAGKAGAQVVNDDCAGGFAQGVGIIPAGSFSCDFPGVTSGLLITDSTDLAVPNFPYPTSPLSCTGYTTSAAAPAKDRWYAFRTPCDVFFSLTCTDTCHISFWSGGDCSMLVPVACYTFPPSFSPVFGNFAGTGLVPSVDN